MYTPHPSLRITQGILKSYLCSFYHLSSQSQIIHECLIVISSRVIDDETVTVVTSHAPGEIDVAFLCLYLCHHSTPTPGRCCCIYDMYLVSIIPLYTTTRAMESEARWCACSICLGILNCLHICV